MFFGSAFGFGKKKKKTRKRPPIIKKKAKKFFISNGKKVIKVPQNTFSVVVNGTSTKARRTKNTQIPASQVSKNATFDQLLKLLIAQNASKPNQPDRPPAPVIAPRIVIDMPTQTTQPTPVKSTEGKVKEEKSAPTKRRLRLNLPPIKPVRPESYDNTEFIPYRPAEPAPEPYDNTEFIPYRPAPEPYDNTEFVPYPPLFTRVSTRVRNALANQAKSALKNTLKGARSAADLYASGVGTVLSGAAQLGSSAASGLKNAAVDIASTIPVAFSTRPARPDEPDSSVLSDAADVARGVDQLGSAGLSRAAELIDVPNTGASNIPFDAEDDANSEDDNQTYYDVGESIIQTEPLNVNQLDRILSGGNTSSAQPISTDEAKRVVQEQLGELETYGGESEMKQSTAVPIDINHGNNLFIPEEYDDDDDEGFDLSGYIQGNDSGSEQVDPSAAEEKERIEKENLPVPKPDEPPKSDKKPRRAKRTKEQMQAAKDQQLEETKQRELTRIFGDKYTPGFEPTIGDMQFADTSRENRLRLRQYYKNHPYFTGNVKYGIGENDQGDGLYDVQIDKMMASNPKYIGTITRDEITNLIPKAKAVGDLFGEFGFIMNLDTRKSENFQHWVAVYCDLDDRKELCYYDPFGAPPPFEKIYNDLTKLVRSFDLPYYLKFKVNRIRNQSYKADTCGFHCMMFLDKMFNGYSFKEATDHNTVEGEKKVEEVKNKFGYI